MFIQFFKLLTKWLCERRKIIMLLFICAAATTAVMLLSGQDAMMLLYVLAICGFFSLCFGISDFAKYISAHNQLKHLLDCIENINDNIPDFGTLSGRDYCDIIISQKNRLTDILSSSSLRETEARDYYTLWTHQIKTPIAAMNLILQNNNFTPESIAMLKSELFRIECYSEMALGYIRLESISDDMVLEEHDIHTIAAAALKKYVMLFSLKKLTLYFTDFSLKAVTDEKWMVFVIEQLLSNSIKYTRKGGISIYADGNCLVISDTGIGISQADIPRLFQKGFTGFNGHMNKKSTGLGLYLCKKITSKLGHKISIRSEKNKGTDIIIDFSQENAK